MYLSRTLSEYQDWVIAHQVHSDDDDKSKEQQQQDKRASGPTDSSSHTDSTHLYGQNTGEQESGEEHANNYQEMGV